MKGRRMQQLNDIFGKTPKSKNEDLNNTYNFERNWTDLRDIRNGLKVNETMVEQTSQSRNSHFNYSRNDTSAFKDDESHDVSGIGSQLKIRQLPPKNKLPPRPTF